MNYFVFTSVAVFCPNKQYSLYWGNIKKAVGEEQTVLYPEVSFGWSNKSNKYETNYQENITKFNTFYVWNATHMRESETSTCKRASQIEGNMGI